MTKPRIVLFGDPQGVPQVRAALGDAAQVVALVQASVRPGQGAEMTALAAAIGAPLILQPPAKLPNHDAFTSRIAALAPDFIVVNSYSMILRPPVLAAARRMAVNVHGGLLPQYRGANVTEWALISEERESGVTAHVLDDGIDTGPILGQKKVPLHFTDTWLDARARINQATEQLLADLMPKLMTGDVMPQPQGEGRHWHRRKPADGAFSWRWPLRRIYNFVRALVAPHPGAQSDIAGEAPIAVWTSLPELARRKFEAVGGWESDGVTLVPALPSSESDRARANARFDFTVTARAGAALGDTNLGNVTLQADYHANTARAVGAAAGRAAAVMTAFCEGELGIADVAVQG